VAARAVAAVARRRLARFPTVQVVTAAFEGWPWPAEPFDLVLAVFRRYEWERSYSTAGYRELLLTYSGHRALQPAAPACSAASPA
jgi:hypothetical protein